MDTKQTQVDDRVDSSDAENGAQRNHEILGEKEFGHQNSSAELHLEKSASEIPWTFRRFIAIASLCGVYVGAQEILYFTSGALNYIQISLHTDIPNWLLTANTLAVTATAPFVGYLTDLLGRKWVALLGALLLVISSAVMGTAKSLGSGLVAQALGGVGAGICELTALAGVAEITPVRWRGVALAAVTFSIVPFLPYLIYIEELQMAASWRYVFLIAGLWNVLSLVGILFCYSPPPRHNVDGMSKWEILGQIDYVGAFLSIGGVTLFLVGLQAAGYQYPASSGKTLGPLISGIILILLFPLWEWKGAKHPMVPGAIFKGQYVVGLAFGLVFVAGMNFYSSLGFIPIMFETLYPYKPITIGVRGLSYPIAILGGAVITSFLMSYTNGHMRQMFTIVAALMTAFLGALAAATPFNVGYAIAMETIANFGIGATVVPSLTLALYACPDRYIGTTAALSLAVRFLGGSVGTAIFFNIFHAQIDKQLPMLVAQGAIQGGLPQSALKTWVPQFLQSIQLDPTGASALKLANSTPMIVEAAGLGARWAYANSLKYVWYATIPFGVISTICALFIPNIRQYMTNRVAVPDISGSRNSQTRAWPEEEKEMPYAGRGGAGNIEQASQVPRPAAEQVDLEAAHNSSTAPELIARSVVEAKAQSDADGGVISYLRSGRGGAGNHHDPNSSEVIAALEYQNQSLSPSMVSSTNKAASAHPARNSSLALGSCSGRGGSGNFEPNSGMSGAGDANSNPISPATPWSANSNASESSAGKSISEIEDEKLELQRIRSKAEEEVEKALARPEMAYVAGVDGSVAGREAVATVNVVQRGAK